MSEKSTFMRCGVHGLNAMAGWLENLILIPDNVNSELTYPTNCYLHLFIQSIFQPKSSPRKQQAIYLRQHRAVTGCTCYVWINVAKTAQPLLISFDMAPDNSPMTVVGEANKPSARVSKIHWCHGIHVVETVDDCLQ